MLGLIAGHHDPEVDHSRLAYLRRTHVLTDYHLHLRPDEHRGDRRALLHRGERSSATSTPRRERGDRRARRLRARLPLRRRRSRSGITSSGRATRSTTSSPTATSCARRRCGWGSRWTSSPAARTGSRACSTRHDFDYVVGSVHFLGDRAVDHDGYDVWEHERRCRARLATVLRDPRRGGALGALRHPRPPRPGQDLGRRAPAAGPRPALLLRAGDRGDRRVRDRGRGLDRGLAQAGRRALSVGRVRGDVRRRRRRIRALLRRPSCPRTSATPTIGRWRRCVDGESNELAVFEHRERRMEPLG